MSFARPAHPSATPNRNVLDDDGLHRLIRGRAGWFLYNRHDQYIGRALERYGEYGQIEADLLAQLLRPGDVAIEVGANIGSLTVGMAKAVGPSGRIVALEPQRLVCQMLCANLSLNGVTCVDALNLAAGERAGSVVIAEPDYGQPGNFGGVQMYTEGPGVRVPLVALDDLFGGNQLRLIKIDVEGMERQVIEGAARLLTELRPLLYVENDRLDLSEALIATIHSFGYVCYWHLPFLYNPDNWFGESENLFPGTVSVNMVCVPAELPANVTDLQKVDDIGFHPMRALQK